MKLARQFFSCLLFVMCGCSHITTMEEFVQTVNQHNDETINNVWYMGSRGSYDYFRHNTTLTSRTYKIHNGTSNMSDRFAWTTNRKNWALIKGNGDLKLNFNSQLEALSKNVLH